MLKEAYSTPIFPLDILSERPPEKKFEWVSNHSIALNILVYLSSDSDIWMLFLVLTPMCGKSGFSPPMVQAKVISFFISVSVSFPCPSK